MPKYFFFLFEVSNYGKNVSCSINTEKAFAKIQYLFIIIILIKAQQTKNKIELPHSDKRHLQKSHSSQRPQLPGIHALVNLLPSSVG